MSQKNNVFSENDNNVDEDVVQSLWKALNNGATLKDIEGIPDSMMSGIYAHAYDFYVRGRLDEAETFFRFLCMYDFYNADYFTGLAAVCQLKKQYQKACDLYAVAFALSKNDYRSVFFSGQCQLLLGDISKATQCFKMVSENSTDNQLVSSSNVYIKTIKDSKDKKGKDRQKELV